MLRQLFFSLDENALTYIIIICCVSWISYKNNKNIFLGILTFIWVIWIGYWAHYLAHNDTFLNYFSAEDNIFSFNDGVHTFYKDFFHFHDKIHHNSKINKRIDYVIIEILQNLFFQGFGLIALLILQEKLLFCKNSESKLCKSVIFFWAVFYATVHMINFNIVGSEIHKQHHINKYTNYDFDIFDIIHFSKTEPVIKENLNHTIINAVIITYLITKYKLLFNY